MAYDWKEYHVKAGDDLAKVAADLGVNEVNLAHWNALGTGAGLRTGQILRYVTGVMPVEQTLEPWLWYTVKAGQTLSTVAQTLHVSLVDLAHWNGMGTGAGLADGQILRYRLRSTPTTPVKVTTAPTTAATAARTTATTDEPHPAVWNPADPLRAVANARYKVEITGATAQLTTELTAAGRTLDAAVAAANAAAAPLEAAAWTAFQTWMSKAATARASILTPALAAYDAAVASAGTTFDQLLGDAETTYRTTVTQADRIAADAKMIVPVA